MTESVAATTVSMNLSPYEDGLLMTLLGPGKGEGEEMKLEIKLTPEHSGELFVVISNWLLKEHYETYLSTVIQLLRQHAGLAPEDPIGDALEAGKLAAATPFHNDDFLAYCRAQSYTPRCAFVPSQLARLNELAGEYDAAQAWADVPDRIINCRKEDILELVDKSSQLPLAD